MPEAAIRLMLEAKAAALMAGDDRALARLIHDDFIYINAAGRMFDKPDYIDAFCTSGRIMFMEQQPTNLALRLIGEVAIATFDLADRFTTEGRLVSARYRCLSVFSPSSLGWQWAAGQTMALAPA